MDTPSCARCGKNSILSDEVTGEQFVESVDMLLMEKLKNLVLNGDHSKKMVVQTLQEPVLLHLL